MTDYRNRVFLGSCEDMSAIPDRSVHTAVTSPPYWSQRSYKGDSGMIGLEATPEEWCDRLVAVFREVKRVLRDDGTCWVNVGDAYCSTDKWGGGGGNTGKHSIAGASRQKTAPIDGVKSKDLIGLPWMLAFALRADGWWLRNDIIWAKKNCMPSPVSDRCVSSHEYIFLLAKSKHYYFDADAIREPLAEASLKADGVRFGGSKGCKDNETYSGRAWRPRVVDGSVPPNNRPSRHGDDIPRQFVGANKRDVWSVATAGYPGDHHAVFPEDLIRPCILAGSPPGGLVLDPFLGSGTTARVAIECGRDFTGYEISPEYHRLIAERLGMFYREPA